MNRTLLITLCACAALTAASAISAQSTDDEPVLLTITGNLIGKLDTIASDTEADLVISSYYDLLDEELRLELNRLRASLDRRSEDYVVAFRAADTAEVNQIVDELSFFWASIRTSHANEFTDEVIVQLNVAYGQLYEFVGGE